MDKLDALGDGPPPKRKKTPPSSQKAKQARPNTIRFPKEVLDYFDAGTPGWQRRINLALLKIALTEPKD